MQNRPPYSLAQLSHSLAIKILIISSLEFKTGLKGSHKIMIVTEKLGDESDDETTRQRGFPGKCTLFPESSPHDLFGPHYTIHYD